MNKTLLLVGGVMIAVLACRLAGASPTAPTVLPTEPVTLAQFTTPSSTPPPTATPTLSPPPVPTTVIQLPPSATANPAPASIDLPPTATTTTGPLPTLTVLPAVTPTPLATVEPTNPPPTEPASAPAVDFVVRWVKMRTNVENSWDGVLNNVCGSDHSIYVHVADAQENLLDGVLIGDRYGNFEVPTGPDGPGTVRILVWSATMELAVMGQQDGTRYTSEFSEPLSTLDEQIPLDWLQQAGYCESPEDCQRRVETNQLCRGHYSYDVVFQRTW